MVRRFSSLFFRQKSHDRVTQAAADNVHTLPAHPGVTPGPFQRTGYPQKTVRHVKSSGALLGTLRSVQYNTPNQSHPPLPAQSVRGLGEVQEYFWLEDSLHRTTSQLDRCSNQLDQIHGSAAEVRRDLEGLQVELELLRRKMQLGVDHGKGEEPRSAAKTEPRSERPKPADPAPKRPTVIKASSIQQRIQFFSNIASN